MRYDRCAHTFFSAICIAATVIFWLGQWVLTPRSSTDRRPECGLILRGRSPGRAACERSQRSPAGVVPNLREYLDWEKTLAKPHKSLPLRQTYFLSRVGHEEK